MSELSDRATTGGGLKREGRELRDAFAASFSASYAGVVAFIAVVTEGSFAKAGERLGVGRSAVSRSVQKLEQQLDARLLVRTTRCTKLTREGELFYERCHPGVERIVKALEDMRELRDGPPRGRLRVRSTVGFGRKVVAPLLGGFQSRYPEVAVDLQLDDAPIDASVEAADVTFRPGPVEPGPVIARPLVAMPLVVCASPAYARLHPLPRTLDELADHRCISFRLASGRIDDWEFKVGGGPPKKLAPVTMISFNDAELIVNAVLAGQGVAQLAGYEVGELLRGGQLIACLAPYAPDDRGYYLCYPSRRHLASRVRAFVDHMTAQLRSPGRA